MISVTLLIVSLSAPTHPADHSFWATHRVRHLLHLLYILYFFVAVAVAAAVFSI